jgi:oligopeptide/dipeptide ABC transporter ATP-binding protein
VLSFHRFLGFCQSVFNQLLDTTLHSPSKEGCVTSPALEPLLEVNHLQKHFRLRRGWRAGSGDMIRAVDDVSFHLHHGETLGLVGESGCGKTTLGRTILRLLEPTAGEVLFRPRPASGRLNQGQRTYRLFDLPAGQLRSLRQRFQMVFQDPYSSLNPRLTVETTVEEGLRAHCLGNRAERRRRVRFLLERVGLSARAADQYPHAFSGGQRQRIGIARALAVQPDLIVCDEPVSALDVSMQAQILNLLLDLQREHNLAYLFIAHDLAVVAYVSHRVAVMYQGQLVELAANGELYQHPAHPYTRTLLDALPQAAGSRPTPGVLERAATNPVSTGCRFQPRCPEALPHCAQEAPPLVQLGPGHLVRCHLCVDQANPDVS